MSVRQTNVDPYIALQHPCQPSHETFDAYCSGHDESCFIEVVV